MASGKAAAPALEPGAAATSVEPLAKLAEEKVLEQFIHQVIDEACGKQVAYVGQYGKTVPVQKLFLTVEYLHALFKRAVAIGWNKEKIVESLEVEGQLPREIALVVADGYAARSVQLKSATLRSITAIASRELADFDWRVNLAWSSSKLATLQEPTLLLTLSLANVDGTLQHVPVEFTSGELAEFISSLEQLNRISCVWSLAVVG